VLLQLIRRAVYFVCDYKRMEASQSLCGASPVEVMPFDRARTLVPACSVRSPHRSVSVSPLALLRIQPLGRLPSSTNVAVSAVAHLCNHYNQQHSG
jgi:hypothetical protein